MTKINANGITLEYDEFGSRSAPPMLLIMGLGGQMIWWDERVLPPARRPRLSRHPLRQPRHRDVDQARRRLPQPGSARHAGDVRQQGRAAVHAARHGGGRGRAARRARDRERARRRRLDGRDDRAAHGDPLPGSACARSPRSCRRPATPGCRTGDPKVLRLLTSAAADHRRRRRHRVRRQRVARAPRSGLPVRRGSARASW